MEVKDKVMTTQEAILEQLHENTGSHFLDSGGVYGRHWQRNLTKSWEDLTRNPVTLEAHVYEHKGNTSLELLGCIKLGAWLEANCEYSQPVQDMYEAWVEANDPDNDMYDMERMERFSDSLGGKTSDGSESRIHYSYNVDNDLSQDIQFIEMGVEVDGNAEENYVLIQIHQGCDARGGLGSPKAYKVTSDYFGNWNIDGYGCESHRWDESLDECDGHVNGDNLKNYQVHAFDYHSKLLQNLEDLKQTNMDTEETRARMTLQAELDKSAAFEEFCNTLEDHSVVVFEHKAYFVGDDGPEEIWAECTAMYS